MSFLVDDLLDFAQLNAGKFRKVVRQFDLREAIEEIVAIQKDKASMGGIKLQSAYKPQSISDSMTPVSMFYSAEKSSPKKKQTVDSEDSEEEKLDKLKYDLSSLKTNKKKEPLMVSTDKRRLQ